jgi:hypothetical protein
LGGADHFRLADNSEVDGHKGVYQNFRRFRAFGLRFYVLEWVRADNAFADSAAAISNTIFPRLWPTDLFRLEAEVA